MPGWDVLAGREAERARLAEVVGAVERGHGGVVLVEGEAGIGKTRLLDDLGDRARPHAATATVTCWEDDAVPPFWPWHRLLAAVGADLPEPAAGGDPLAARVTLFDAVTGALAARARGTPLVLVLDDAQWADELSRAYLRFAATALREVPVVVAAGVRTGEPAGDTLADEVGRYAVRLRLGGLAPADLAVVVESVTGTPPAPDDLAELHRRTAGNPLFARELAALPGSDALPGTVRVVLGRRVARVAPEARELLGVAAVVGDAAPLDVLAATLGTDAAGCVDRVGAAVAAGVAVLDGAAVSFAHPLLRSAVLDSLGVAERIRLHQRVAAALEALRDAGRPVATATLAGHLLAAAGAGSAEPAVGYAVAAADEAMAMAAYEQAAHLYDRALATLDVAPAAYDRATLLRKAGAALTAAGRPGRARVAFVAAAAAARAAGDPVAFAEAALAVGSGEGFEVTLFDTEQQALLDEAVGLVGDRDPALRARLVARRSVARSLAEPPERRQAAAEEALAVARAAGDPAATCDALAALCDAVAGPADAERRVELAGELLATATRIGDLRRELLGRRLLVVAHLERRDVAAADEQVAAYAVTAARLRSPLYAWYVPLWRGLRAAMDGDDEAAERHLEQAEAIGRAAGSENAEILVLGARCVGGSDAGHVEEAVLAALPDDPMLAPWLRVTTALAYAVLGRRDDARRLLDLVSFGSLPVDSEYLPTLVQAAVTIHAVGGHPLAATAYDLLLPHRERYAVEGIGAYCHGSVERHLGLLAAVLGQPADARAHVAAARAANAGHPGLLALTDTAAAASGAAPPAPAAAGDGVFRRDGDIWTIGLGDRVAHVKDAKGIRDLAVLLARPGEEVAALDLLGGVEGGDLGETADATARAAYRRRLADLEREIDDADDAADLARGERARAERDALVAELASAYGLGGRARRAGSPAERARTTVTARIRDALRRIEAAEPAAGAHLRRSVRTGTFCAYDAVAPVRWRL